MLSSPTTTLLDPTSPAYKKARRQFYKATRNRPANLEQEWTPFRAAEKRYKARFPPPDLSSVLDLAILDKSREEELAQGGWLGSEHALKYQRLDSRAVNPEKVYILPDIPGLVILPSFLSQEDQRQLVRWSLERQAREPNLTNLDVHYHLPKEGLWNAALRTQDQDDCTILPKALDSDIMEPPSSGPRQLVNNEPISVDNYKVLVETPKPPPAPSPSVRPASPDSLLYKLRWVNIGWHYHWGTKQYDFSRGKGEIDDELRRVCKRAVDVVDWRAVYEGTSLDWEQPDNPEWQHWDQSYDPDAGIVNFYQTKASSIDTLMAHVDRSEVCSTSPLVSISLGNAAIFLIGGKTRDSEPIPILLRSGDAVIMSGPACRRAYHGVPRILEGTLPPHMRYHPDQDDGDWRPFAKYLESTRINVNVRQVFPRGFDAEQHLHICASG